MPKRLRPSLASLCLVSLRAAFVNHTVVSTNFTSAGLNLTRHELFANFNGATDTVLNVFNFQAQGGWAAHADAAAGFWHRDLNQDSPALSVGSTHRRQTFRVALALRQTPRRL
jgi:hypothetical protein